MLNCKEVTHLLSDGQDRRLTLAERMMLEAHLLICRGCANFARQMVFLRAACRRYGEAGAADDERSG